MQLTTEHKMSFHNKVSCTNVEAKREIKALVISILVGNCDSHSPKIYALLAISFLQPLQIILFC